MTLAAAESKLAEVAPSATKASVSAGFAMSELSRPSNRSAVRYNVLVAALSQKLSLYQSKPGRAHSFGSRNTDEQGAQENRSTQEIRVQYCKSRL